MVSALPLVVLLYVFDFFLVDVYRREYQERRLLIDDGK